VRFVGCRAEDRKRNQHLRRPLTDTRSGHRVSSETCITGSGLVTDCTRSSCNECGGRYGSRLHRDKQLCAHQMDYAVGSSRHRQPCVDFNQSGGMPSCADVWRVQSSDPKLRCYEQPMQRQRGFSRQMVDTAVPSGSLARANARLRCPSRFMSSLSSIRSASSNDEVRKPDSRACLQKYRHSGPCDFICPTGTEFESRRRFTRGSGQDVVKHSLTRSSTPSRTNKADVADVSPNLDVRSSHQSSTDRLVRSFISADVTDSILKNSFNNSSAGSPPPRLRHPHTSIEQWRPSSVITAAHEVASSTDRPSQAFNKADVADVPPDLDVHSSHPSSTERPVRSFISADLADSSLFGSHDRLVRSFISADVANVPQNLDVRSSRSSSTVIPSKALNKVDVRALLNALDRLYPDLDVRSSRPSSTDRPVRSFISADLADSALFGSQISQISSTDRPARSFNSADFIDSLPGIASGHDSSRHPFTDSRDSQSPLLPVGGHVDHGGPSVASQRQWKHFYSDCGECPNCLSFALCGVCNTIHELEQDANDCLPRASNPCDRGFPTGSNESALPIRGRYLCGNTGDEFLDRPAGSCSVQNMDLHSFVNREMARVEDCRGLLRGTSLRESCYSLCCREDSQSTKRDTTCTRFRSLHFYTDCTDCPTCCSSSDCESVCGSCCSVHGPPEEPDNMSPRCTKPLEDDVLANHAEGPSASQELMPVDADRVDQAGDKPGLGDENNTDVNKPLSGDTAPIDTDVFPMRSVPPVTAPTTSGTGLVDSGESTEEECWSWFELACCGALAVIILLILLAIYLQVTRRVFTG